MNSLYPILARFDLFRPNVDAFFSGPHSYFSLGEVVTRLWQNLIPQQLLGRKLEPAGMAWGSMIRPQGLGDARTFVSLAEGPIAEGWVLAGWGGILLEIATLALAIIAIARLYERRTLFATAFAVAMTGSSPYLFERGLLGISEGIGKSLQIALIVSLFYCCSMLQGGGECPAKSIRCPRGSWLFLDSRSAKVCRL